MLVAIIVAFILVCFAVDVLINHLKKKDTVVSKAVSTYTASFDENSVVLPKGLFFDKAHTWAFREKNGNVKIGINDFLQHITGTITRIDMKKSGEKIRKGEPLMTIVQNGKQLYLYAPISGTIKTQNWELNTNSSIINSSPYFDGWVYTVEPSNWLKEVQFMMMAEKATEWLKNEFARLKDFLAEPNRMNTPQYAYAILQDGGELKDCVLEDFGPKVWDDFQTDFIDAAR